MAVDPDELVRRMAGVRRWRLRVAETAEPTPGTRRIRLAGRELATLDAAPGQDMMFWVEADGGGRVYRRYTVRRLERAAGWLDIEVAVGSSDGPGARWARRVVVDDDVDAVGPRGKITIVPAAYHVFVGDESYVPAAFAMLEALPAETPALAVLEAEDASEERPVVAGPRMRVTWVHRGGRPPGDAGALVDAVRDAALPDGRVHAYVGAELRAAGDVADALRARGLNADDISAKAYWRRGHANAGHGEPPKDEGSTG